MVYADLKLKCDDRAFYSFVTWPLNENEAGGDLVLIETSLLFTGAQPKAGTGHKMQTGVWKTRIANSTNSGE